MIVALRVGYKSLVHQALLNSVFSPQLCIPQAFLVLLTLSTCHCPFSVLLKGMLLFQGVIFSFGFRHYDFVFNVHDQGLSFTFKRPMCALAVV